MRSLKFLTSMASEIDLERLIKQSKLKHFAFVGKSNVGKSSLINHLAQNKGLAKVSSTPGKTQLINLFGIPQCLIVDLPGYGFARVSKEIKYNWNQFIQLYFDYFYERLNIFILIDPVKPIGDEDFQMIEMCESRQIPYVIIFTKIDQVPKMQVEKLIRPRLTELKNYLKREPFFVLYSIKATEGRDALISLIESNLNQTETDQ